MLTSDEKTMYAEFCQEFQTCWACDTKPFPVVGDPWAWHTWILDCSHIVGGPGRRADRRCITRLCRSHHMIFDGFTIKPYREFEPIRLSLGNILWLKQKFDPEYLDIEYLRTLRTKKAEDIKPEPIL